MLAIVMCLTAVLTLRAAPAYAQTTVTCSQNGSNACSATASSGSNNDVQALTVNVPAANFGSAGIVTQVFGPSGNVFSVSATAQGPAGSSSTGGGNTEGITLTNGTSLSFTVGSGSAGYDNGYLIGLFVQQAGGVGNPGGSAQAPISITNTGQILAGLSNFQTYGDYGIQGISKGGDSENGGYGGVSQSGGVSISNSGQIGITGNNTGIQGGETPITNGGAGIQALTIGGASSANSDGGSTGGNSGAASVTDSALVNVYFQGQGGSTDLVDGVYGVSALSTAGAGGNYTDSNSNNTAGTGGNAGSASVTLTAGATVDLTLLDGNIVATPLAPDAGVAAESLGGAGGISQNGNGVTGGLGGSGGDATVTLTDANVATNAQKNGNLPGVLAFSAGGAGGCSGAQNQPNTDYPPPANSACSATDDNPSQNAGNAGNATGASVSITSQNAPVTISSQTANGDDSAAIEAFAVGGAGGWGGYNFNDSSVSHGGNGGNGGDVTGNVTVSLAANQSIGISADGEKSPALAAISAGGAGGLAYGAETATTDDSHGGDGGNGGVATDVTVDLNGNAAGDQQQGAISLATNSNGSPGILAISAGGTGGEGGAADDPLGAFSTAYGDPGGAGGASGNVQVNIYHTSIATSGTNSSPGILAFANGGAGGVGGAALNGGTVRPGAGGAGGTAQDVTVNTDSNSAITTSGAESVGILAESLGGGGGAYGGANGAKVDDSQAGGGGNAGNVTVNNASSISTTGASARGILAQSEAGIGGGSDTVQWGLFHADGSVGGTGGAAGIVDVTNSGDISVTQSNTEGVVAQSIGGAGGSGGSVSGVTGDIGGQGGTASDGNNVTVTQNGGTVNTSGYFGIGVLAQSIGGDGGDGGGANGGGSQVGGDGGNGADGAYATVNLNPNAAVETSNDESDGVVVQSIGGGGGNGGNASASEVFSASAIGGTGGDASNGGQAGGNLSGASILTEGTKAYGLVVQSIGGGGGNGGDAEAFAIGPAAAKTVALGGTGGDGGAATYATADLTNSTIATGQDQWLLNGPASPSKPVCPGTASQASESCNTLPVNSYGVVVQSIGGGGGTGGSASAESVAISIPGEEDTVSLAIAIALGADGGGGGGGGQAQFDLSNGSAIVTAGEGSDGVLAQSIGGGGGAGGDASEMAAVIGYGSAGTIPGENGESPTSDAVTIALGRPGKGGTGADTGGTVEAALGGTWSSARNSDGINAFNPDPAGSAGTAIVTFGDYADAIDAQSIGGGGGDAGVGSGNTQSFGTSRSSSVTIDLGAVGGTGGNGGSVAVGIYAPPGVTQVDAPLGDTSIAEIPVGITTYGSGALGILAQSVGGGGGSSEGGSFDVAQSFATSKTQNAKVGLNLSIGGNGVSGGEGFPVNVIVQAPITTHGGDATGVLAQSIGGGGGLGGSAGADASQDNPVIEALAGREAQSDANNIYLNYLQELENEEPSNANPQLDVTYALSIGGTGGTGGTGGSVDVDVDSAITTGAPTSVDGQLQNDGDWADGVVAQSVGGGGGKGGTSIAAGSGGVPEITLNLDHAIGGSGGTGGNGYYATVFLGQSDASDSPGSASVSTDGFGAAGVVAQSIGGGGGIGTDGSDSATGLLSVGGVGSGQSGGGGDANAAEIETGNEGSANIATIGDNADGVIVQSIGGGGGIGGAGSSAWVQNQSDWSAADSRNANQINTQTKLSLYVGGGAKSSGHGSNATFDSTNGPLNISTTGNGAFGILAQSIGGGGGLLSAAATGTAAPLAEIGGTGTGSDLSGGTVIVNLGEEGPNTSPTAATSIITGGNEAFGVVAQSIGSGGGILRLASDGSGISPTLTVGPSSETAESGPGAGSGGQVTINMSGNSSINVTGEGSIGIFAQSLDGGGGLIINGNAMYAGAPKPTGCGGNCTATRSPTNIVYMQLSGPISATGNNGIGIFAQVSGAEAAANNSRADVVTYNNVTGGTGSGAVGIWVDSPASNNVNLITNAYGTVTTENGVNGVAILSTGGSAGVAVDGKVIGRISGANNLAIENASAIWDATGFELGRTVNNGTINIYNNLEIGSDYRQNSTGKLGITVDSLNHAASHLQVDGDADIAGLIVPTAVSLLPGAVPIIAAKTLKLSATGLGSLLFDWNLAATGNSVSLSPLAHFRPNTVALTDSQSSLASYLQRAWGNGDAELADEFASLSRVADGGQYKATLDAFSGKAAEAQSAALINSAGTILGAAMSCPVYVDQGVRLGEDSCIWLKVTAQQSNQWESHDTQGYRVGSVTTRIGGQQEFGPDWYIGGSLAIGQTSSTEDGTSNGDSDGNGQTYDGSIAIKHQIGPWLLAGSVAIADGEYRSDRQIDLPGTSVSLRGDPSLFLTGGRFRAGYQFAFSNLYVQPEGNVDIIYTDLRGFREDGPTPFALDVRGNSKVTIAFSPMVELGGRLDLNTKTVLRPFAEFGGTFIPDNSRSIDSAFTGTSNADGLFHSDLNSPGATANFGLGVQLYRSGGLELKAEYNAAIGGSFISQSAGARFAYHF